MPVPSARPRRLGLIVLLLISTVACDQASKALARAALPASGAVSAGGVLELRLSQNPGAFLSFGAGLPRPVRVAIFTVGIGAALAAALAGLLRSTTLPPGAIAGAALIVGGGLGNLIDRLRAGSVTDFLILRAGPVSTGIFNVADAAILSGGLLLAFALWKNRRPDPPGAGRSALS